MKMRPNLSIERLAVTLAALGTSAVVTSCTRAEPAATRPDTPMSSTAAPPPPPQAVPEEKETKDESKKAEPEKPAPTATASARPIAQPRRKAGEKGGTGQASCGAGTCTADPKKK